MEELFCRFFFFQAEDGIRDGRVTGETCALPIFLTLVPIEGYLDSIMVTPGAVPPDRQTEFGEANTAWQATNVALAQRSEERRVGKACRARGGRGVEEKDERAR